MENLLALNNMFNLFYEKGFKKSNKFSLWRGTVN